VDLVNFSSGIPGDDNGHGTHVAGTITSKNLGVASGAELYAVKILDSNAEGDLSTLLMALQWAIDNKMDVANMSIGFREDEPVARLAVQRAYEAGMVLVAASGNHSNWDDEGCRGSGDGGSGDGGSGDGGSGDGGSGDGGSGDGGSGDGGSGGGGNTENAYPVMYPAKYPQVIAVGAMDSDNSPAPFSNTGPELDLMAPGVDTVSTHLDDSYGVASGTSMSSAHVSGAVALMVAVARDQGKSLTPAAVKRILRATAVDGTINLVDALNLVTMQPRNNKR
jgi:subtilisin family serine protease